MTPPVDPQDFPRVDPDAWRSTAEDPQTTRDAGVAAGDIVDNVGRDPEAWLQKTVADIPASARRSSKP